MVECLHHHSRRRLCPLLESAQQRECVLLHLLHSGHTQHCSPHARSHLLALGIVVQAIPDCTLQVTGIRWNVVHLCVFGGGGVGVLCCGRPTTGIGGRKPPVCVASRGHGTKGSKTGSTTDRVDPPPREGTGRCWTVLSKQCLQRRDKSMHYCCTIAPAMGERTTPGSSKSVNCKLVLVPCEGASICLVHIASSATNTLLCPSVRLGKMCHHFDATHSQRTCSRLSQCHKKLLTSRCRGVRCGCSRQNVPTCRKYPSAATASLAGLGLMWASTCRGR